MGRIHFYHTVWRRNPTTNNVEPLEGVESSVYEVIDGEENVDTTVGFVNRLGVTAADMFTNDQGVVNFWLDPGDYNVHFSDPTLPERIAAFQVGASAVSGSNDGVLLRQLPALVQASVFSPGDIKCVGYTSPDDGWLLCDGSLLSRVEYALLFARIGLTFNTTGEAVTQFRLPDLRGRVPVGADLAAGRLSALDAVGNVGGEEKHIITAAETGIRNHRHAGSGNTGNENHSLAHSHTGGGTTQSMNRNDTHHHSYNRGEVILFNVGTGAFTGAAQFGVFEEPPPTTFDTNTNHEHTYSFTTTSNGAAAHTHPFSLDTLDPASGELPGAPHANMQPYQILNWMIKT